MNEPVIVVEPVMASVPAAVTLPVLLTVKRVVVAKALVEDAILKSVVGETPTVEEAANRERKEQMAEAIAARFGYRSKSDDIIDAVALAQMGVHFQVVGGADLVMRGVTPGW